jgi:hypothetical protein
MSMETDPQDVPFLASVPDSIDFIKVFPFVIHLKRDVIVRSRKTISLPRASNFLSFLYPAPAPSLPRHGSVEEYRFVSASLIPNIT